MIDRQLDSPQTERSGHLLLSLFINEQRGAARGPMAGEAGAVGK